MRILIPLLAVAIGIFVVLGTLFQGRDEANPTANQTAEPQTTLNESVDTQPSSPDALSQETSASEAGDTPTTTVTPTTPTTTQDAAAEPLQNAPVMLASDNITPVTLGSNDPETGFKFTINLSPWGAGVSQIALTDYEETLEDPVPYVVHQTLTAPIPGGKGALYRIHPYSARTIVINGQSVDLMTQVPWTLEPASVTGPRHNATYTAIIASSDDEAGEPLVAIERTYAIEPGSYDIRVSQTARNLTDRPLDIRFTQFLQGDNPRDHGSYLGDRRYFVPGYFDLEYDPRRVYIYTEDTFISRTEAIKQPQLWPAPEAKPNRELAWIASENRYFALITHLPVPEGATSTAQITSEHALQHRFSQVSLYALPTQPIDDKYRLAVLSASTPTLRLQPQAAQDLGFSVYAGPRKRELFEEAPYSILNFDKTIRYSLGGLINCCTWQFLARWLLAFLGFFHWVFADWGVAIIFLVVTVRLILHPIMKNSQLSMMRMGKIMQKLKPEIDKIKKKYENDPTKAQAEQLKLMREAGANPMGMLGCLPMFLQMPIWTALYAMLYYAIELRHEPAFWGVFQSISGGSWRFLSDLSGQDQFITFPGEGFHINLGFVEYTLFSLNILPILMAVVFFINNLLMTPPPADEQQASMQRTMRFMFLLFPIFLYFAPAGLTLYMTASTGAGILDSWIVRRHLKAEEESGRLFEKKKPKPGGFWDRINKAMEQAQAQVAAQQEAKEGGRKKVQNQADGQPGGRAAARRMKKK